MASRLAPIQVLRRVSLGLALVGLTVLSILHQRAQGIPTIDALDPFGGLETLLKFVAGGEIIKKIEPGTIVLFGALVALGLLLSRFFCGWFCGFGALQAVFGWLGKKLFRRRFVMPPRLDRALRWLKYPVLVLVVYFTWRTGELVIRPYDPLAAYGHLSAGLSAVWGEFAVGLVLLVVSLALSLLYERAFCKYLCPLGAVNAILGRLPIFRIKREASTCISCSRCDKSCPMNIDVSGPAAVTSPECIGCMECVTVCPTKKATLRTTLGGKTVALGAIVALGFAVYAGAAAVGQAAGMLSFAPASLSSLATSGKLKVGDIKGSSTWESVASSFGIELERLYRETGVDGSKVPGTAMLKDTTGLGDYPDFSPDTMRVAVAKILGLEYIPETEAEGASAFGPSAPAPAPAVPQAAPTALPAAKPQADAGFVVPADFVLEGSMSVKDLALALKTSEEAVISRLGLAADIARDKPLRDMKDQYGYSMPALKEKMKP
jgi:ferredoxin